MQESNRKELRSFTFSPMFKPNAKFPAQLPAVKTTLNYSTSELEREFSGRSAAALASQATKAMRFSFHKFSKATCAPNEMTATK